MIRQRDRRHPHREDDTRAGEPIILLDESMIESGVEP